MSVEGLLCASMRPIKGEFTSREHSTEQNSQCRFAGFPHFGFLHGRWFSVISFPAFSNLTIYNQVVDENEPNPFLDA
ncbi:MAG: hypothetical protein ACJ74Z_17620 [Bryobacteraceae bacterium]